MFFEKFHLNAYAKAQHKSVKYAFIYAGNKYKI